MEYPRHEGDIRLEHPNILESQTGPTFPCPDTYALVEHVDAPLLSDITKTIELAKPQLIDGKWITQWNIRSLTEQELLIQEENLRMFSPPTRNLTEQGSEPDVIG
jgi:hypothetical protein